MWMPVIKVLAAIVIAGILIWIASRKLRSGKKDDRVLRSLPGNLVQEIADRLDAPDALLAYLKEFFGCAYTGAEQVADAPESLRSLLPVPLPEEEFADLIRTAAAIEPDALLAYACQLPGHDSPAIVTVCRNGEKPGVLLGVFRPE